MYPAASVLATAVALICAASAVSAQEAAHSENLAKNWKTPRTEHGQPDLQGVWTSATITPLERPDQFGDRLVITEAEAQKLEMNEADYNAEANAPSDLSRPAKETCRSGSGPTCGYNNFWIDRGSQVVTINGERRSSLIVDPVNGKVPLKPERRAYLGERGRTMRQNFDGPEARPLGERCLLAFGSSSGPPMLPVLYNNHYQIVQTKDAIVILVEMVHDARIIRLNGAHLPDSAPKWMGDSVGRWDGEALVVETTNFTDHEGFRGGTPDAKIVERFRRVAPDKIEYRFTIEDPKAFTQAWSGEIPFYRTDDPIYEYACHEGNYALPGILAGAREEEKVRSAAGADGKTVSGLN